MDNNRECSSSGRHRRKWNVLPVDLEVPKEVVAAVKEEVSPQYEHYLLLLQQRNRMLRKLKTKSSQEIALERKEQGFTLYINGANAAFTPGRVAPQPPSTNQISNHKAHSRRYLATTQLISRRYKTMMDHQQLKELELDLERELKERQAVRTAPLNRPRRKRWNLKSLDLKLAGMSDSVTSVESYDDDFESDHSSNEQSLDNDWTEETSPYEDNEILTPQPPLNSKPKNNYSRPHYSPRGQKLTLNITDIKKLKDSLEANPLLQLSVAEELSSSEESDIPEECNEVNDDNSNSGSQEFDSNLFKPDDHVVLEFGTPARKSERKLCTVARKNSADGLSVMESIEKDVVLAAIQAENSQPFPTHISSRSEALTEQDISSVTNNVLLMKPRQQINLIKMLGKLEESASALLSSHQEQKAKAILCPESETNISIHLELLTNWGHEKRIGLTEIQLFHENGKIIPIQPEEISVKNATNESASIHTLFNGKAKTSKIKNMWSCDLNADPPVVIGIHYKNTQQSKELSLAKIKIWNYNHNLKDLNIGVKHMKIFVGEALFYNGNIEKGCGNHIFDYSTTIDLSTSFLTSLQVNNNICLLSKRSSTDGDLYKLSHCQPQLLRKTSLSRTSSPILSPTLCVGQPKINSQNASIEFEDSLEASPRNNKSLNLPLLSSKNLTPHDRKPSFDFLKRESSSDGLFAGRPGNATKESPRAQRAEFEVGSFNRNYLKNLKGHDETEILPDILDYKSLSPRYASKQKESATDLDKSLISPDSTSRVSEKLKKNKDSFDWLEDDDEDILCQISENCEKQPDSSHCQSTRRRNSQPLDDLKQTVLSLTDKMWHEQLEKLDLPLLSKDNTNQPIDQCMGDSVEIPLQPILKLRNKPDKSNSHLRTRVKRDGSGVCSSPSVTSTPLRTILDEDFPDKAVESQIEDQFNMDIDETEFGRCTPMQKIQKKRAKWRGHSDNKLEEYWGSLNYFNHLHRGRLSMDGDILDKYLNEAKTNSSQAELVFNPPSETSVIAKHEKQKCRSPSDDDFIIPELPYGQELVINIRTTWGDKHYVGLTGIDIFSDKGDSIVVKKITANPKDINILPEYDKDPRIVQNLIDGVNRTRDDVHMWLTPFTTGRNHCITMTFAQPYSIALIRIWNYNKSRIHSFRGARDVDITLDGKLIFRGEIARACGGIEGGTEAFGDTILFSVEEEILEAVSRNDEAYEGDALEDISWEENLDIHRPNTATIADDHDDGDRPFTRACGIINEVEEQQHQLSALDLMNTMDKEASLLKGKHLKLNFTQTWGDLHYLGLTSLEVFGIDGQSIPLHVNMITADPQDLHSLSGHERDDRTLDKLIDGTNVTISDEHMWLVPFTSGQQHLVNIEFPQSITISGIRIWNYNKNVDDTYRGAKIVHVEIDGRVISPIDGYLLRKGLGNCHFDFCQEISFMPTDHMSPRHKNLNSARSISTDQPNLCYETVPMPSGFIYQLQLFSTWGDPYYIGLNGLQFYDSSFNQILLEENNIAAYPDSVNVLNPNQQTDVRTPDKLIDGINDTKDGAHMWLAPVLPSIVNKVYVIFDQPTTVSMIKIWNYNKTPSRATKDFALLVDELLVCNGTLPAVSTASRGILPTCDIPQPYHTILFSGDQDILLKEKHTIISNQAPLNQGQDIQMTNNRQILTTYESPRGENSKKPVNQAMRPGTCVTGQIIKKRY